MEKFNTSQLTALVEGENINEVFRKQLEEAINTMLNTELSELLGYDKYDRSGVNIGNSRNVSYQRSFDTEYGTLELQVSRDRNCYFQPQTIEPYNRRNDSLETTVIQLYSKDITTAKIAELIEQMYGAHYYATTVSNITKSCPNKLNPLVIIN